jgi:hypothetical protein
LLWKSRRSQPLYRYLYSRREFTALIDLIPAAMPEPVPPHIPLLRLASCAVLIGLVLMPGCVRRRLMVRSNPPGAMVYVDNQLIGTTPCATDFVYYGTREMRLVKSGYETMTINQPIPAPWYQIPPLDFVSENMVPRKIQDFRTVSYDLTPQVMVPTEQLINRGEELRRSTQQGLVLPPGDSATLVIPPPTTAPTIPIPSTAIPETLGPATLLPAQPGTLPAAGQPLQPVPPTE